MIDTIVAAIFTTPIQITGVYPMLLLIPLSLSIAVVYKTIKVERTRDIVPASLALWITIVFGMYAVGVALWGLFQGFALGRS